MNKKELLKRQKGKALGYSVKNKTDKGHRRFVPRLTMDEMLFLSKEELETGTINALLWDLNELEDKKRVRELIRNLKKQKSIPSYLVVKQKRSKDYTGYIITTRK